jgi:hypothetical protein
MPEYFKSVRYINLSTDRSSRAGLDIYFERTENPPPDNPDVEQLRGDYEETMAVMKDIDLPANEFETLFNELIAGAQIGLQGERFNVAAGRNQLNRVQRNLVRFARRERDKYLARLSLIGGIVTVISLLIAGFLIFVVPRHLTSADYVSAFAMGLKWLIPGCLLHPGVVLGVVFIAFVVNRTLTFDKIRTFDPYYFSPGLRFLYVSIISYVLFAALWFNLIMLGIGGFLLNNVKDRPGAGLLIGLVCGISEAVVVELLVSRFKPVERSAGQQPLIK